MVDITMELIKDVEGNYIHLDGPASALIHTVCCICNKSIGHKDGEGISGDSYSYCNSCMDILLHSK